MEKQAMFEAIEEGENATVVVRFEFRSLVSRKGDKDCRVRLLGIVDDGLQQLRFAFHAPITKTELECFREDSVASMEFARAMGLAINPILSNKKSWKCHIWKFDTAPRWCNRGVQAVLVRNCALFPYLEDKTFVAISLMSIPTCDWCAQKNLRLMDQVAGRFVEQLPDNLALCVRDLQQSVAFEEGCRNKKCRACGRGPGDENFGQPKILLRYCGGCRKVLYCGRVCQKADRKSHKKECGKEEKQGNSSK